jgi:hypothetical protein
VLREAMLALLTEDQLPICRHVELAFLTFDDRGVVQGLLVELGRETRGPAVIAVSDGAVVDLDACHCISLSPSLWLPSAVPSLGIEC